MGTSTHSTWFSAVNELSDNLGSLFSDRAANYDHQCQFVQKNYDDLKEARFFSLGIPQELGGGGLSYSELCATTQQLAHYCGSTALAFAMHSHPVALNVFKYHKGDQRAKNTLEKIAGNELIIAGTGANDWLSSSGSATAIEGGFIVNAHKRFVSGGPGAQVMVSSVHFENPEGNEVLHFSIPFSSEGIRIQNNWKTLGMRATGSNDVILENVFVPAEAVVARRPAGQWHGIWDAIIPNAMPLIVSAYLGLAERASQLAKEKAKSDNSMCAMVGTMNNHLVTAQLALEDMITKHNEYQFAPKLSNTEAILCRKTIATKAIKQTVELASNIVGGAAFFQGHPLERIVRDIRAMHFHPLPEHKQVEFSGRVLLEKSPV